MSTYGPPKLGPSKSQVVNNAETQLDTLAGTPRSWYFAQIENSLSGLNGPFVGYKGGQTFVRVAKIVYPCVDANDTEAIGNFIAHAPQWIDDLCQEVRLVEQRLDDAIREIEELRKQVQRLRAQSTVPDLPQSNYSASQLDKTQAN